jgi:quaternary ammonium compound-resistance protein SugE
MKFDWKIGAIGMPWILLFLAGVLEICWTTSLKYTEGYSKLIPTLLTIVFSFASFGLLGLALKTLPMGTAYAIWTGIGTAGTALLGIYLFGEPATISRLTCIGLILAGIIALRIVG